MKKDTLYQISKFFLNILKDIRVYKFPMFIIYQPDTFRIKGYQYYEIRKLIQPGDILLRGYIHYLDSYFIPGFFSHAAMYVGDFEDIQECIIHAVSPCVTTIDLCTFCRCDKLVVLRPPKSVNQDEIQIAINKCIERLQTPYDFLFNFSNFDKMSCSELCYYCYKHVKDKMGFHIQKQKVFFIEKEVFTPTDIFASNMNIVWQCDWTKKLFRRN